ncbi:hypothetical protein I5Q82_02770 [Acutalibacter muris]|uniref:Uncharacterized protein n=1 Tax=Acutalibacter muris TaxID=1796620 RepID=A0A1Z2XSI4_9FIRM|nr:hypothetical protein [Acutalibacter muris]ASB41397.1 hypothetical protein ADH66_12465 [Acutalibacter muris]QQR30657.1 hypothetical protein I5Q82_02770 [Acutalibacter muris]
MSEKMQKYAYWMTPSMVAEITKMMPEANATSKTDFLCFAAQILRAVLCLYARAFALSFGS